MIIKIHEISSMLDILNMSISFAKFDFMTFKFVKYLKFSQQVLVLL